jgi:hypothetical protein
MDEFNEKLSDHGKSKQRSEPKAPPLEVGGRDLDRILKLCASQTPIFRV